MVTTELLENVGDDEPFITSSGRKESKKYNDKCDGPIHGPIKYCDHRQSGNDCGHIIRIQNVVNGMIGIMKRNGATGTIAGNITMTIIMTITMIITTMTPRTTITITPMTTQTIMQL